MALFYKSTPTWLKVIGGWVADFSDSLSLNWTFSIKDCFALGLELGFGLGGLGLGLGLDNICIYLFLEKLHLVMVFIDVLRPCLSL